MSTEIDLPAALLTPPDRIGCDIIGAWMLWPKDENTRSGAIRRYIAKRTLERKDECSRENLILAAELALDSPDENSLQELALKLAVYGTMVGKAVRDIIGMCGAGEPYRKDDAFKRAGNALASRPTAKGRTWPLQRWFEKPLPNSTSSMNNTYWPLFRPVAHFWAAWLHLQDPAAGRNNFPCDPDYLLEFLAVAEQFRVASETTATAHSGPIIAPGESYRLPDVVLELLPVLSPLALVPVPQPDPYNSK